MTKEESIANRVKALMAKNGYTKFQATAIVRNEDSKPKAQMGFQQPWYNQNYNLDNTIQSQAMSPQQNFSTGNQDYLRMAHTPAQAQNPAYQSMVNPTNTTTITGEPQEVNQGNEFLSDEQIAKNKSNNWKNDNTNWSKAEQINNTNVANLYGGVDLEGALAYAGRGFGTGNAWQAGIGSSLFAVKGARNFLSGFASGQSDKQTYEDYMKKLNQDQTVPEYQQQGGKIKNSEVMATNAITNNPQGNLNLEGGEFVKRANGMVQPVVGEPHIKNGKIAEGVDAQLNGGDKVLSDYVKLRPNDIKELKSRYDISLKKGDTPAKAQTKFDAKIGLKKEEEGLATLAEKLEKALKIKDSTTQELSVQALQSKIAKQNEKIAPLKEVSAMAFEDFFMRQESQPKLGTAGELFDKNGKKVTEYAEQKEVAQQGGEQQDQVVKIVQAYAQASGQDPQQIMQQLQQMQPEQQQQAIQQMVQELQAGQEQGEANQGMQEEQSEMMMQQGGLMEMASKYGISPERAQELIKMQQGGQPQEQGQDQQMQQIMQQVAQALQQGADPNEVLQQLIQMGVPQTEAQQLIQQVANQIQGQSSGEEQMSNPQEEGMEVAQQGKQMGDAQKARMAGYFKMPELTLPPYGAGYNSLEQPIVGTTAVQEVPTSNGGYSFSTRVIPTVDGYDSEGTSVLNQDMLNDVENIQSYTGKGYGAKMANVDDVIKVHDWYFDTDAKKEAFKKAVLKEGSQPEVKAFQEAYNKQITDKAKKAGLSDEQIKSVQNQVGFSENGVKKFDGLFGAFTSTRPLFNFTKKGEAIVEKSPTGDVTPQGENKISPAQVNNKTVFPMLPQRLSLPPSGIQPIGLQEINLGRLEPNKATIEPYLANQAQQQLTAREQLSATGLPPQIQEALSAQQFATGQMSANDAISKTENFNRTNQMQVDQFNIGQRAKEDITNAQFKDTYMVRNTQARDNSEKDWRAYFNELSADNARNYSFIENTRTPAQDEYTYVAGKGYVFNNNKAGDISTSLPANITQKQMVDMTPEQYTKYMKDFTEWQNKKQVATKNQQ